MNRDRNDLIINSNQLYFCKVEENIIILHLRTALNNKKKLPLTIIIIIIINKKTIIIIH